ncbi:MAG TPA: glycosyltransferase family 2 protein [Dongiaceae bacterium]|jgi:putative glycosyltransferase
MKLSIVTTMYKSAGLLAEFCKRAAHCAGGLYDDYEIVLVNDGSPDDSRELALSLMTDNPRIVLVDLSRNFGHHQAMMAGLEHAGGDRIFLIDCDLEEEPELLAEFHKRYEAEGDCDVVYGYQTRRKGSVFERLSGWLFYKLINALSDIQFMESLLTARLMSRRYVESLLRYREREIVISGLWALTGFKQVGVPASKGFRGESSYTTLAKFKMMVNSVASFSAKPLFVIVVFGLAISALSVIALIYMFASVLIHGSNVPGWASVMVSVWFLGGLIILFLGVIGTYIAKIFIETKNRPLTIVRAVHRGGTQVPPRVRQTS